MGPRTQIRRYAKIEKLPRCATLMWLYAGLALATCRSATLKMAAPCLAFTVLVLDGTKFAKSVEVPCS